MTEARGAYAGIVSRGLAFAVDGGITLVVATGAYQLALAALSIIGSTTMWSGGTAAALGYLLAVPVVFIAYCAGFWTLLGRTPGMMLLGLRVVALDGGMPGGRRSLIRVLAYWISAIFFLGFAWIAVDRRNQGFHDKIAGTFVVYDWGDQPRPKPVTGSAGADSGRAGDAVGGERLGRGGLTAP